MYSGSITLERFYFNENENPISIETKGRWNGKKGLDKTNVPAQWSLLNLCSLGHSLFKAIYLNCTLGQSLMYRKWFKENQTNWNASNFLSYSSCHKVVTPRRILLFLSIFLLLDCGFSFFFWIGFLLCIHFGMENNRKKKLRKNSNIVIDIKYWNTVRPFFQLQQINAKTLCK